MDVVVSLRDEAAETGERRLLVLAGDADATREYAADALAAADVPRSRTLLLGDEDALECDRLDQHHARRFLGETYDVIVLDCHGELRPNALGAAVGAVDGGGILVLLTPPLDAWPDRRDGFDDTLAVPPFDRDRVGGHFRRRLCATLRTHPGIAIVDVDAGRVERDGLVDAAPRLPRPAPSPPAEHDFPTAAYEACRTADQVDAVAAFERLLDPGHALVVEADRGRGKSSAAGLAVASLALAGTDVLVTAPEYRNAAEAFARAEELLVELGELAGRDREGDPRLLETETGRVRYEAPADAAEFPGDPDRVVVDEAAALPVRLLGRFLDADGVAFTTTVHGYEGTGRGFAVRFRDRLLESRHEVTDVSLATPIRYAPADPVEVWAFRALCLDAGPAVDPLVADATPETASYRRLSSADLLDDEHLLREAFGLLVVAHYRTEPNDLARLLDAPNVSVRALGHEGHVVAVALLAREGDLPADRRARMYEGERVRGNMLPDVLTSQLRDEAAGDPVGYRVVRIATHPAVRSRGLGSCLLDRIRDEFDDGVDWLGVGYGATPDLVSFWRDNGFDTVHLSTTRNDASGEYSAIMLSPLSPAGEALHDRHTAWFLRRVLGMLSDPLDDLEPDVVREALRAVAGTPSLDLSDREWRVVAGLPNGAAIFDTAPEPFRRLTRRHLVDPAEPDLLTDREERLLVGKALQARPWSAVADDLDYHSHSTCRRAFGAAVAPLVEAYGTETAQAERRRFE